MLFIVGFSGCEEQESETELEWFQIGNSHPITQLQTKQSIELENNRMGDMYTLCQDIFIEDPDTSEDPDDFANRIGDMGLKWMRVSIDTFGVK